jgi:hypothetical protein
MSESGCLVHGRPEKVLAGSSQEETRTPYLNGDSAIPPYIENDNQAFLIPSSD